MAVMKEPPNFFCLYTRCVCNYQLQIKKPTNSAEFLLFHRLYAKVIALRKGTLLIEREVRDAMITTSKNWHGL
jgi:hypothetical protein